MGSFLGGGSKTSSVSRNRVRSEVRLPAYLEDMIPDLANRIEDTSLIPYQPYTDQRFADFSPEELQAFQGVQDIQGQYQPLFDEAIGLNQLVAQRAADGFSPEEIERYMNPYQQLVTDISKREAIRDFDKQMNAIGDLGAQIGAFGGSRHGIVEAEAYRDIGQRLDDLQTQGLQQSYDRALSTAMANQQFLQNAAVRSAELGAAGQAYNLRDLAALEQVGATQRGLEQAGLDFDYGQFAEERQYPFTTTQFATSNLLPLADLVKGQLQVGRTTNVAKQSSSVSPISAALGIGSTLMGMPGMGIGLGGGSMFSSGLFGLTTGGQGLFSGGLGNMFNSARGYYGPGFKKGGHVKKYQDGGFVDYLSEVLPIETVAKLAASLRGLEEPKEKDPSDTRMERLLKGAKDLPQAIPESILKAAKGTGETFDKAMNTPLEVLEAEKQLKELPAKHEAENKQLEAVTKVIDTVRKDEGLEPLLQESVDETNKEEKPTPSRSITPQQSRKREQPTSNGYNLPLLALGARLLASPGESGAEALGKGMQSFIATKMALDSANTEKKQQEIDNELAQGRLDVYRLQTETAANRAALEEKLFPYKQQKIQSEIIENLAQATGKSAKEVGSIYDTLLENDIRFKNLTPQEQQSKILEVMNVRQNVLESLAGQAQADATTKELDDPLGLLQ